MKISIELTPEEAKEIMNKKHWEDFVQRWIADDRAADMLPDEPQEEFDWIESANPEYEKARATKLRQLIRGRTTQTQEEWDRMVEVNDAFLNGYKQGQKHVYASYNYYTPRDGDHPGLDD